MPEMDAHTIRTVAGLVRGRIERLPLDTSLDGMERLGAHGALTQLVKDLDVAAKFAEPRRSRSAVGARLKKASPFPQNQARSNSSCLFIKVEAVRFRLSRHRDRPVRV